MKIVRDSAGVLAAACLTTLAVAVPATASATHSTDDFDFDADGLCAFTVHLTVHDEIDAAVHATGSGTREIDTVVETDTLAAHGKTVHGLAYHYTVTREYDAEGNPVAIHAQGEAWRFRLPDGGIWSVGGRVDFLTDEHQGSWQPGDGLGPVCDALA